MGKNARECEALLCGNTRKNCSLSFFTFPVKEPERLKRWLQNITMKNSKRKEKCLCSDHFEEKSFTSTLRTRLLPGAVPSIQGYTVHQNSMNYSNYKEPVGSVNKSILNTESSNERNEQIVVKKELDWDYDDGKNDYGLEFEIVNRNIKTEPEKYNSITIENNTQADNIKTEFDYNTNIECIESSQSKIQHQGVNLSSNIVISTDLDYLDINDKRTFKNLQNAREIITSHGMDFCHQNNNISSNTNSAESCLKRNGTTSILRHLLEVKTGNIKEYANRSIGNDDHLPNRKIKTTKDFVSRLHRPEMRLDIMKRSYLTKCLFIVARPRQVYLCKICMKHFYHKPVYINHILLHIGKRPFSCNVCKKDFLFEFNLRKHNVIHMKGAHYYCFICKTKLKSESDLIRHQKLHSAATFSVCKFCGRNFETEPTSVTCKAKPFRCEMCRKCHTVKAVLMVHQKTHYPNKCSVDDQKYHSDEKLFQCEQCRKQFKSKLSLISHRKTHSEEKSFRCEICGKLFKKKTCLKSHQIYFLKQHFQCNICEKCFICEPDLSNHHRKRHFGGRIFLCKLCEKCFHRRDLLLHHMAHHLEEKLYSCELCNKSFKRESVLLRHQKMHLKERQFPCEYCAKSFTSKPKLVVHKISHYSEMMIRV